MERYLTLLSSITLFQGISSSGIQELLTCLSAKITRHNKNEFLLLAGETPHYVGIVLEGDLQIIKEDYAGRRSLVAQLEPGDLFAEALVCARVEKSPVSVLVDKHAVVMKLDFLRLLQPCSNSCVFHQQFIENMLMLIARKNLFLQSRIDVLGTKSIREKVLHYFESFVRKQGHSFTVSLNRQEMADYLGVDRSALSHELMKMKQDGLIDYRKNKFSLLR